VEKFCSAYLPQIVAGGYDFFVNVVGHRAEEFADVIRHIEQAGLATTSPRFKGYELDLSCPNVDSGTIFATDPEQLKLTTRLCRNETDAMLVDKLSPNVTDIASYAGWAVEAGADAVTIANTWNAVSIDTRTRKSHLSRPSAGLSGAAIRPATLYQVWRCRQALPELVIFGSGGITDAESAIEFLLAGATVLQVGTGLFLNPKCPLEIREGLLAYLEEQGEATIAPIIGTYAG
jgi:dihydroorotate dehydrogenase (NAD+) catalytic subunit